MQASGWLQFALYFVAIVLITKPMGLYLLQVLDANGRTWLDPVVRPLERVTYRLMGVDSSKEHNWKQYTLAMLLFSLVGCLFTYAILRLQNILPLNPQGLGPVSSHLAFNTAVSFTTNTNWQNYSGETTLSYLVQMVGLTMHNFTSAAAGIAIAVALIRGFARQQATAIGNFWADLVRATVYVLLPLSVISALFFCSQGVIQNLHPYTVATTVEGKTQTIAQGPVASQEAIKMLGTNGGGFFNANSSHPLENPTPLSNFLQMFFIFLIPGALTYTFGKMAGDTRQGWALFAAMSVLWLAGVVAAYHYEQRGAP